MECGSPLSAKIQCDQPSGNAAGSYELHQKETLLHAEKKNYSVAMPIVSI